MRVDGWMDGWMDSKWNLNYTGFYVNIFDYLWTLDIGHVYSLYLYMLIYIYSCLLVYTDIISAILSHNTVSFKCYEIIILCTHRHNACSVDDIHKQTNKQTHIHTHLYYLLRIKTCIYTHKHIHIHIHIHIHMYTQIYIHNII